MKIRFGICADLHSDYIHDADLRLSSFLNVCRSDGCDFALQLGDFATPGEEGENIKKIIADFGIPLYHTLGNHDMDEHSKNEILSYLGYDRSYYSFDMGGVHFIILDTCYFVDTEGEKSYNYGNYKGAEPSKIAIAPKELLSWLVDDLAKTSLPSVVFSHHSLIASRTSVGNTSEVEEILNGAPSGVLLAISGHEHVDRLTVRGGIYYWCVNSISYYWAGSRFSHTTYGEEIESEHPILRSVFPYKDPVFAIVEITDEKVEIKGVSSEIVGLSPQDMDFSKPGLVDQITPSITYKTLPIKETK